MPAMNMVMTGALCVYGTGFPAWDDHSLHGRLVPRLQTAPWWACLNRRPSVQCGRP